MVKKIASTTVLLSAFVLTACSTTPPASSSAVAQLTNKNWIVTHIGNTPITSQADVRNIPSLQLDGKANFSGADGCNRIMGSYVASNTKLKLNSVAQTMMACVAVNSPDVSKSYTDALAKVSSYQVSEQTLILKDAAGTALLQFTSPVQPR